MVEKAVARALRAEKSRKAKSCCPTIFDDAMYEVLEAKKKEKTFREFLTSDHFESWSKAEAEKAAAAEAAAAAEVAVMNHSESELEEEESNDGEESDDDDDDDHFHLGSIEVEHHEWSSSGQGGENDHVA